MDKDTKNFFEKLSGVNGQEENEAEVSVNKPDENSSIEGTFDDIEGQLAVDVYQTPSSFIIEAPMASVKPEDVDVSITPESVTIKGKREKMNKIKEQNYLYQECFWGSFSRSIILPQEVDPDKSHAALKDGVLKINLSKANKAKSKKIKIKFE